MRRWETGTGTFSKKVMDENFWRKKAQLHNFFDGINLFPSNVAWWRRHHYLTSNCRIKNLSYGLDTNCGGLLKILFLIQSNVKKCMHTSANLIYQINGTGTVLT